MGPNLLSLEEVRKRLGIGRNTLWTWMKESNIEVVRIGRRVLIDQMALDAWLASKTQPYRKAKSK